MANSWGKAPASDDNKPYWLTPAEMADVYATSSGWVYRQPSGNEELLVALRGLADTLSTVNLTSVYFDSASYSAGTGNVIFAFDEVVSLSGSAPTIVIGYTGIAGGVLSALTGAVVTAEPNQIAFPFTTAIGGVKSVTAAITAGTLNTGTHTVSVNGTQTGTTSGTGATFSIVVGESAIGAITVSTAGTGYSADGVITIDDTDWAGVSGGDLTLTITSIGGDVSVASGSVAFTNSTSIKSSEDGVTTDFAGSFEDSDRIGGAAAGAYAAIPLTITG